MDLLTVGIKKRNSVLKPDLSYGIWMPPSYVMSYLNKIENDHNLSAFELISVFKKILLKEIYENKKPGYELDGKRKRLEFEKMTIKSYDGKDKVIEVLTDECNEELSLLMGKEIYSLVTNMLIIDDEKKSTLD